MRLRPGSVLKPLLILLAAGLPAPGNPILSFTNGSTAPWRFSAACATRGIELIVSNPSLFTPSHCLPDLPLARYGTDLGPALVDVRRMKTVPRQKITLTLAPGQGVGVSTGRGFRYPIDWPTDDNCDRYILELTDCHGRTGPALVMTHNIKDLTYDFNDKGLNAETLALCHSVLQGDLWGNSLIVGDDWASPCREIRTGGAGSRSWAPPSGLARVVPMEGLPERLGAIAVWPAKPGQEKKEEKKAEKKEEKKDEKKDEKEDTGFGIGKF